MAKPESIKMQQGFQARRDRRHGGERPETGSQERDTALHCPGHGPDQGISKLKLSRAQGLQAIQEHRVMHARQKHELDGQVGV